MTARAEAYRRMVDHMLHLSQDSEYKCPQLYMGTLNLRSTGRRADGSPCTDIMTTNHAVALAHPDAFNYVRVVVPDFIFTKAVKSPSLAVLALAELLTLRHPWYPIMPIRRTTRVDGTGETRCTIATHNGLRGTVAVNAARVRATVATDRTKKQSGLTRSDGQRAEVDVVEATRASSPCIREMILSVSDWAVVEDGLVQVGLSDGRATTGGGA